MGQRRRRLQPVAAERSSVRRKGGLQQAAAEAAAYDGVEVCSIPDSLCKAASLLTLAESR